MSDQARLVVAWAAGAGRQNLVPAVVVPADAVLPVASPVGVPVAGFAIAPASASSSGSAAIPELLGEAVVVTVVEQDSCRAVVATLSAWQTAAWASSARRPGGHAAVG